MGSNFDEFMFMAIKESKSMEDILQKFFSFLRRHTDFCHTMLTENQLREFNLDGSINTRGFRPNHMKDLVNKIVEENVTIYRKSHQPYLLGSQENKNTKNLKNSHPIESNHNHQPPSNLTQNSASDPAPPVEPGQTPSVKYTINPWNGAITEKYAWSQTFQEVTLEIVSAQKLTPRDVQVLITKDHLKVQVIDQVLVDGEFCHPVNSSDSMWSIEDGFRILLNIEKSQELWWDCVVKGDETIDTQQIESVKRLDEFSTSEQNAILKMMKDHKQKYNL